MNEVICSKCGQELDPVKGESEFRAICQDPVFIGLFVTCGHCGNCQAAAVMDQDQVDAFKEFRDLQKQIARFRKGGWRAKSIAKLQKQADILQGYMEARAPMLMDMYTIAQEINENKKARENQNHDQEKDVIE